MESHHPSSVIIDAEHSPDHIKNKVSPPINKDTSPETANVSSETIRVSSSVIEAPVTMAAQDSGGKQSSDSLSLLRDTLPGFKSTPSPTTPPPEERGKERYEKESSGELPERSIMPALTKGVSPIMRGVSPLMTGASSVVKSGGSTPREPPDMPPRSITVDDDEESDSEIDEDALSIIIAVEGEDDDSSEDMSMEVEKEGEHEGPPILRKSKGSSPDMKSSDRLVDLTIKPTSSSDKEGGRHAPSGDSTAMVTTKTSSAMSSNNTESSLSSSSSSPSSSGKGTSSQHSKQSAKVKQFFTTLQMFGNRTSQEVAEQVQELITALVNDLVTVEEFHHDIQNVTNHPLKEFVVPFLKENLAYFRDELKSTSVALSDILGSTPKSNAPAVAPEISEPELVVVPSTKPSAPVTTSTIMTAPTSPLRAPANLTSMSVPPATIHEPPVISPTKIESVLNASVLSNNRKRPRDLAVGNTSGDERDGVQHYKSAPKRQRPIPTATLTPEPIVSTPSHIHHATPISTQHFNYSRNPSSVTTPTPSVDISPAGMSAMSANHRTALVNQMKEDWNHLETMLVTVEGMVVKTQKALSALKERIQQIGLGPSPAQLKLFEMEIEQKCQQKMEKTIEEVQHQASEEKQRLLMDATKQLRDALRDMNTQTNSKESCWNCGRKATETCSGCNKARYCGTFCQHKDWDRHMKQCAGARPSPGIRPEKERTPVQISPSPHNHIPSAAAAAAMKPSHYIAGPHPHVPPGQCYIRSTTSRTPTPTSYTGTTEIFVPYHGDPLANGNSTLTSTSSGVAVVTINRSAGDLTPGVNMV